MGLSYPLFFLPVVVARQLVEVVDAADGCSAVGSQGQIRFQLILDLSPILSIQHLEKVAEHNDHGNLIASPPYFGEGESREEVRRD